MVLQIEIKFDIHPTGILQAISVKASAYPENISSYIRIDKTYVSCRNMCHLILL